MDSGTSLGPYRIDRELGSGGMGKVYAATVEGRCPGIAEGTCVALKVVHPHLLETPGFFKRFMREAELGQSIRHENVVRTYDCDQVFVGGAANAFLVMEHVEGQTLRELLVELDRVPEELCRHIAPGGLRKASAAIHEAGVVPPGPQARKRPHHRKTTWSRSWISAWRAHRRGAAAQPDRRVRRLDPLRGAGAASRTGARTWTGAPTSTRWGWSSTSSPDRTINPYLADDVPRGPAQGAARAAAAAGRHATPALAVLRGGRCTRLLAKDRDDRFADARTAHAVLEEGEDSTWWRARATGAPRSRRSVRSGASASHGRPPSTAARERESIQAARVLRRREVGRRPRRADRRRGGHRQDPPGGRTDRDACGGTARTSTSSSAPIRRAAPRRQRVRSRRRTASSSARRARADALPALDSNRSSCPRSTRCSAATPRRSGDAEPLTKDSLQTCFVHALRGRSPGSARRSS